MGRSVNKWVDDKFIHKGTGKRVSPESSLTNPDVHNPASGKKLELDERRKVALQLRQSRYGNGSYMSFADIAEAFHERYPELIASSPGYAAASAYRDVMAGLKAIHDDIRDLAKHYLLVELEKLDNLDAANIQANEILFNRLLNYNSEEDDIESLVSTLNKLSSSITRVSDRRSKLLGMDAPKEIHAMTAQINMTMDDFLQQKDKALKELKDALPDLDDLIEPEMREVVEGEFEEEE